MKSKKYENARNYDQTLFKVSFNLCKIINNFSGNMFVRAAFESFTHYSNLTYKCPLKSGSYFVNKFDLGDLKLPIPTFDFYSITTISGQISQVKRKSLICNLKFVGKYRSI